jgi:ATP-dependent helicase Lhr and Lhr-like helicase
LVVLLGGALALYVERGGRTILSYVDDEGALATAAKALAEAVHAGALEVVSVERTDGAPIHNTPLGRALTAAGFRQTPRGLRPRG